MARQRSSARNGSGATRDNGFGWQREENLVVDGKGEGGEGGGRVRVENNEGGAEGEGGA